MTNDFSSLDKLVLQIHHNEQLVNLRLLMLEETIKDHEQRIRAATDGVTQFKIFSSLSSGGSSIIAIIALIKTFLSI